MSESLTSNTISVAIESEDTTSIDVSGLIIKGDDGFSPTIDITQLESGVRITATDKDKTSVGEVTVSKENVISALGYTPADEDVLPTKVDKVDGKSLSTNDFTDDLKAKLDGIEEKAEVNVQSNWSETDTTSDAYILNKPDVYIKTEVDAKLLEKANNATTIGGYGITDAYTKTEVSSIVDNKVDKVDGKSLSTNDFTDDLKAKLDGIEEKAEVNVQSNWSETDTTSDAYILNKPDVYIKTEVDAKLLEKANNATTIGGYGITDAYTKTEVSSIVDNKVDKVTGKSLSTEDFTSTYKEKLDSIEDNAEVNVQSDWNISDTTSDAFIKNKPNIYLKSETDTLLNNKVDKVTGKSLISDSEITRLSTVSNYDDTGVKSSIDAINTNINTINNQIAQIQKITFSLNSDNDIEAIIQI